MTTQIAVNDVCCVAFELSKSTWVARVVRAAASEPACGSGSPKQQG